MTYSRPVHWTLVSVTLLCVIHFFTKVYTPFHSEIKQPVAYAFNAQAQLLPYSEAELSQLLLPWLAPVQDNQQDVADATEQKLKGFDQALFGDVKLALIAIYQHRQPVVVFAVVQPGQPLSYQRIKQGESLKDIQVVVVKKHEVQLRQGEQLVTLRLFNPDNSIKNEE